MSLGPDDIVNYEFKQSLRGYAVDEVDDLLDRLADQVERTDRDLDDLRQRLRDTEARLASALETESTLKRTFVTAQQAAERSMADAREQADELREAVERDVNEQLDQARAEAERIVADAHKEARDELADARQEARSEVADARQQRAAIEERIATLRELERRHRALLERHLRDQLEQLDQLASAAGDLTAEHGEAEAASGLQVRVHSTDETDAAGVVTGDVPPEDAAIGPDEPFVPEVSTPVAGPDGAHGDEGLDDWARQDPAEPWRAPGGDEAGDSVPDDEADAESDDQDLWAWSKPPSGAEPARPWNEGSG